MLPIVVLRVVWGCGRQCNVFEAVLGERKWIGFLVASHEIGYGCVVSIREKILTFWLHSHQA